MSKLALLRRTSLAALVLGVLGAGVAGAAPVGQITEFGAPGTNPAQVVAGADGNPWFTDRGAIRAIGRIGAAALAAVVTPPSVTGSGGVNVPQSCDGDVWSSWRGSNPPTAPTASTATSGCSTAARSRGRQDS